MGKLKLLLFLTLTGSYFILIAKHIIFLITNILCFLTFQVSEFLCFYPLTIIKAGDSVQTLLYSKAFFATEQASPAIQADK